VFGIEYPSIDNLVGWPTYFGDGAFWSMNKVGLISMIAMSIPVGMFLLSKKELVPSGLQNVVELTVEFIDRQIILPSIGADGRRYMPLLLSMFVFVFFGNIFEVIPTFQMPANARMANPVILAIVALGAYVRVGFKYHGFGFIRETIWPSFVPVALRPLVGLIDLLTVFIMRPFALAVRLFANMLAGHILLVTFGVLCITLWQQSALLTILPFSFTMLVLLTAFEIFVSFLQAYVFALLTAVYIDASLHPAH